MEVVDVVDGLAEIDATDGDTDPEDQAALDNLGMTDDERREIASRYPVDATFWRMPVKHLSPYDWNYAGFEPDPPPPPAPPTDEPAEPDDDDIDCGSIINCQSRTLSEVIPIAGTPYYLRYDSDRSPPNVESGRTAIIPLPENPPAVAESMRLEASVLGRVLLDETIPLPLTNSSRTVVWDGLDAYGRPWVGPAELQYKITYNFQATYQLATTGAITPQEARSFGIPVCNVNTDPCCVQSSPGGGFRVVEWAGRTYTSSSLSSEGALPLSDASADRFGLGGWSLSHYHAYDVATGTLYLGSGGTREVNPPDDVSAEYVTGSPAGFIDGYRIGRPQSVAAGPGGDVYFSDSGSSSGLYPYTVVWRSKPEQEFRPAFEVDGACYSIADLAVSPEGTLHYACATGSVYRAVEDAAGQWSHEPVFETAAVGEGPVWEDGLPLDGSVLFPRSIAFRDDGRLFLTLPPYPTPPGERIYRLVERLPDGRGAVVASSTRIQLATTGPNNTIIATHTISAPDGSSTDGIAQIFPDGSAVMLATSDGTEEVGFDWRSTETHGPYSNTVYALAVSESGDVFFSSLNPTFGKGNYLYQISNGVIRKVSLGSWTVPGWSQGINTKYPNGLAGAPDGSIYMVDDSRKAIYTLRAGGYAAEVASRDGTEIYRFSSQGLHESTRDALTGDTIFTFEHDSEGLYQIIDRAGRVTRLDRPDPFSITITAPAGPGGAGGPQTILQMNAASGLLELVTDPRQGKWFFEYGSDGLLERLWDPRANEPALQTGTPSVFEYEQFKSTAAAEPEPNAKWVLKRDTDPVDGFKTLAIDHARELTPIYGTWCNDAPYIRGYSVGAATSTVTKGTALGRTTRYITTSSSDAPTTTTREDPNGWYVTRTDPDGAMTASSDWPEGSSTTTFTSDPTLGNSVRVPAAASSTYAPVGNHPPIQLDATYDWQSTFDPTTGGYPTPNTETTTVTLTPVGSGGSARTQVSTYDRQSRTLTVNSEGRLKYSLVFDDRSRIAEVNLPGQVPIVFDYFLDDTGDEGFLHTVTRQRDSEIRQTTMGYDERGYINSVTERVSASQSDQTTMVNDPAGFTTDIQVSGLTSSEQRPDAAGSLEGLTPGGKPEHRLAYTPRGRLSQYAPPGVPLTTDGTCSPGAQCWYYTLDRELDSITLPDGTILDYGYHPITSTLEWVDVPRHDGPEFGHDRTEFTYDSFGRRSSALGPTGATMSFDWQSTLPIKTTWDGVHTVLDDGLPVWSGRLDGSVERFYSDFLELSDLSVSGGASLQLFWDDHGLLDRIEGLGSRTLGLMRSPVDGHVESATLNRVTVEQDVDVSDLTPGFGDLKEIVACLNVSEIPNCESSTENLYGASYTFDERGRVKTWTENVEGGLPTTRRFHYDGAGRLRLVEDTTDGEPGIVREEYEYDANGNRRKAVSEYPGRVPVVVEFGTNLGCPGDPEDTPATDQDQICQYGSYTYEYNSRGQLRRRREGAFVTEYFYDGRGRLKKVSELGMEIHYVHDAVGRRIGKIRDGSLEKGWLYKDGVNPIAQLDSSGNIEATFVYGTRKHVPDAMVMADGTTYRFVFDHLGSVRLVVDVDSGTIVQRLDYDAFGRVLSDDAPGFQPFGFAGGLYDDDTGLVRFGARDYDAYTGTWTSRDAILFAGGDSNLYAYVGNDPVNQRDPLGEYTPSGNTFRECLADCRRERDNSPGVCSALDLVDGQAAGFSDSIDRTGTAQRIGLTHAIAAQAGRSGLESMCRASCVLHMNRDHLDDLRDAARELRRRWGEEDTEAPRPPEAPDGPNQCFPEDGLMCVP
jgi:RHS repeat-associated protein